MNRIIVAFIFLAIPVAAFSQINKGTVLIGGDVAVNQSDNGSRNMWQVEVAPMSGYFVKDNWTLGLALDFSFTDTKYDGSLRASAYTLQALPFTRYYIHNFYGELSFGGGLGRYDFGGSIAKNKLMTGSFGLGYAIFLNDHLAIEPKIGYAFQRLNQDNEGDKTDITNKGLFFKIGIQGYLNR